MRAALALALLALAVAVLYWAPLRRLRAALGLAHLVGTGHAFLVFGAIIGLALGDEHHQLSADVAPIVGFVAGWVGFAVGMRFDHRVLRTVPPRAWGMALAPALAAAAAVAAASLGILLAVAIRPVEALAAALVLGAAAASSGPTLVAVLRTRRAGRATGVRADLKLIELSAGVDDLLVILLATLAFSLLRPAAEAFTHGVFTLASLFGGVLLGLITWLFLGGRATDDERLLLGVGMLMFSAGCAAWLHLSPASVAAVAAIILVNLPGDRGHRLFEVVRRVERPAVVILMTFMGFSAVGSLSWVLWPLVAAMTLLRALAKLLAGAAVAGPIPTTHGVVAGRRWALGLVPQGTLGLMIVVTFFGVWDDATARTVLAAVAVASLLNELVAPWLLLRVARDASVAPPAPAPAVADRTPKRGAT